MDSAKQVPLVRYVFCEELQNEGMSLLQQKAIEIWVYVQPEEICGQFVTSSI